MTKWGKGFSNQQKKYIAALLRETGLEWDSSINTYSSYEAGRLINSLIAARRKKAERNITRIQEVG